MISTITMIDARYMIEAHYRQRQPLMAAGQTRHGQNRNVRADVQ